MAEGSLKIKVKTWPHYKGDLPAYQSPGSSGFDVRAMIEKEIVLNPMAIVLVPTGLSFEIPLGFEIQVRPRSGLASKHGLTVVNAPGTIDADYRGEVKVALINLGPTAYYIQPQERMAQFVVSPVVQAQLHLSSDLSETSRAEGGFGSTGQF